MKRNFSAILIYILLAAGLVFLFSNCTPQQRLNRLHKNHPKLFTTDTVYSTRTFTVPGFSKDTSVTQNTDLSGLKAIFEAQGQKIDSLIKRRLLQQVSNYILERPCLKDTLNVPLQNGGFVKIWQAAGQFNYQQRQNPSTITRVIPYSTYSANIMRKYSWQLLFIGIFIGWATFAGLILYIKNKHKNL